jgi:hypothetical protein
LCLFNKYNHKPHWKYFVGVYCGLQPQGLPHVTLGVGVNVGVGVLVDLGVGEINKQGLIVGVGVNVGVGVGVGVFVGVIVGVGVGVGLGTSKKYTQSNSKGLIV